MNCQTCWSQLPDADFKKKKPGLISVSRVELEAPDGLKLPLMLGDAVKILRESKGTYSLANGCTTSVDNVILVEDAIMRIEDSDSPNAKDYLLAGLAMHSKGDSAEALSTISRSIEVKPTVEALMHHGRLLSSSRKEEAAVRQLEKAIELDGEFAAAFRQLAVSEANLEKLDAALGHATKAIELAADDPSTYYVRAQVHGLMKDAEKSLADYEHAAKLTPFMARYSVRYAQAKKDAGEFEEAEKILTSQTEAFPEDALPWYHRGWLYAGTNRYEKAKADLQQALEIDPDYFSALFTLSYVEVKVRNYADGLKLCEKMVAAQPDNLGAHYRAALCARNLGQVKKSLKHYTRAIELDPDDEQKYYNRGVVYGSVRKTELALADYTKAIELGCKTVEVFNNRGNMYDLHGDHRAAIADYGRALEINDSFAFGLLNRSRSYLSVGDIDEAVADGKRAVEVAPTMPAARMNSANAYLFDKQYEKAIREYDVALELIPGWPEVYRGRWQCYWHLGKREAALKDYKQVTEGKPRSIQHANLQAWLLATNGLDDSLRDGERALKLAHAVCRATNYQERDFLDSLAAAYAETGDFENALKWQEKAVEMVRGDGKKSFVARLDSYKDKKPWRE